MSDLDAIGPALDWEDVARIADIVVQEGRPRTRFETGEPVRWIQSFGIISREVGRARGDAPLRNALSECFNSGRILLFKLSSAGWELSSPEMWINASWESSGIRYILSRDIPEHYLRNHCGGPQAREHRRAEDEAGNIIRQRIAENKPWPRKADAIHELVAETGCSQNAARRQWDNNAPDAWKRPGRRTS